MFILIRVKFLLKVVIHWEEFMGHIDILVRESLILNSRWSMENMLELRIGYGFGPVPIFHIHVSIEGCRVHFISLLTKQRLTNNSIMFNYAIFRLSTSRT